jgi:hypothetical protein
MPESTRTEKARRNRFSQAHAHLFHAKNAWRNEVMHPKATYTDAEAEELLSAVKTFMNNLASLLTYIKKTAP